MARVKVEYLSDTYDGCELCGTSWAEGFRVLVDGEEVTCLEPIAACTSGQSFTTEDLLRAVLAHFGHELEIEY
jgi:hypothetical protein